MTARLAGVLALAGASAASAAAQSPGTVMRQAIPGTSVELSFTFVPAGEFMMGSPADEVGRDEDEGPRRRVRLEGFWMGVHEVTYDQFAPFRMRRLDTPEGGSESLPFDVDAVTRPSPPYEDPAHGMGQGEHPAAGMTRLAALHYARWLSFKTGRLYRLPTEAEWEYACRAGGEGPHGVPPPELERSAWFEANAEGTFHPVGQRAANAWGLHDMLGNVAEWMWDGYAADYFSMLPSSEISEGPEAGSPTRGRGIVRGGAFDDPTERLRCAERFPESAAWKRRDPQVPKSRWWNTDAPHVGFRLVSPAGEHGPEAIRAYWAEVLGA